MKDLGLMHGNDWTGQDVSGWYASEKLDGWRARWTGAELLTRSGNAYTAPDWFTRDLPPTPLDCELWLGRGLNCNDVHRAVLLTAWHSLKLVAFDVPQVGLSVESAQAQLAALRFPSHARAAKVSRVASTKAAFAMRNDVTRAGGEGIMLRKPGTAYQPWRSDDLLKLKP